MWDASIVVRTSFGALFITRRNLCIIVSVYVRMSVRLCKVNHEIMYLLVYIAHVKGKCAPWSNVQK